MYDRFTALTGAALSSLLLVLSASTSRADTSCPAMGTNCATVETEQALEGSNNPNAVPVYTSGYASANDGQLLYSFCRQTSCDDGQSSNAPLLFDLSGNLLGATTEGAAHGNGAIFKITFQR